MVLGDQSSSSVIPEQPRKRRKRSSFYFSSLKALKRTRMTRGKKVVSKTKDVGASELRKSLRFESVAQSAISAEEDGALVHNSSVQRGFMEESFTNQEIPPHTARPTVSLF